ncbi:hypothetical protein CEUSTIGMA_g6644.t1 [Chlamydomonas eustigma]|uniref:Uncharacterized protein n=1 Tax=Chlamydomonas eustigma TaxID=1157962 RepID=A0A250X7Z5_9CHLO|nr:hypothetical protein CEUSTIGMA_g6644.t1 [Chlamydomonas eustigma]|eukprot:GAX79204.1 hypothetical protein CEUSTIGMA_g6644.t1 [Chlamydomonas eustigma]
MIVFLQKQIYKYFSPAILTSSALAPARLSRDKDMLIPGLKLLSGTSGGLRLAGSERTQAERIATAAGSAFVASTRAGNDAGAREKDNPSSKDDDMKALLSGTVGLRFDHNGRLKVALELLDSSHPIQMACQDLAAARETDAEVPTKLQQQLWSCCQRVLALPLGRGALTLGTLKPLPSETVEVPALCLTGLLNVDQRTQPSKPSSAPPSLQLDLSTAIPALGGGATADITAWSEFHNGVAAGLRMQILSQSSNSRGRGVRQALATCAVERPEKPSYSHAGTLFALGLTKRLSCLAWTDLYRYLSEQHDATTIGVLLGAAACHCGTSDARVSKMLLLHVPASHPESFPELELTTLVQASALIGLGLLHQGSCQRGMVELFLSEMQRRPGFRATGEGANAPMGNASTDGKGLYGGVTQDREGYALAAGIGLGMVLLGKGRDMPGLSDMELEDRLRSLLQGGRRGEDMVPSTSSTACIPLQSITNQLSNQLHSLNHHNMYPLNGGRMHAAHSVLPGLPGALVGVGRAVGSTAGGIGGRETESKFGGMAQMVLEGPCHDLAVTAPAASLALMLMFLKSNDLRAASHFTLPGMSNGYGAHHPHSASVVRPCEALHVRAHDNSYRQQQQGKGHLIHQAIGQLEGVRPDLLLLRVLGQAMVMWNSIVPSLDWVQQQLPEVIQGKLSTFMVHIANMRDEQHNSLSGIHNGFGLQRQAGSASLALAHVHGVTGACLALGIRYAGTGNEKAYSVLHHHVLELLAAKAKAPEAVPVDLASQALPGGDVSQPPASSTTVQAALAGCIDKGHLESCLCVVLLAMSVVMAGSGHPPSVNLIKQLIGRLHPGSVHQVSGLGINYGTNMALSMAMGFLFLGAGELTFSTSKEAVAALLVSLFPRLPTSTTDNRCHLQALRHLYALAAQPRCLTAIDIDSGQEVVVPLMVEMMVQDGAERAEVLSMEAGMPMVTPCLLPERSQVSKITVCGARYWRQVLQGPSTPVSTQAPLNIPEVQLSSITSKASSGRVLRQCDTPQDTFSFIPPRAPSVPTDEEKCHNLVRVLEHPSGAHHAITPTLKSGTCNGIHANDERMNFGMALPAVAEEKVGTTAHNTPHVHSLLDSAYIGRCIYVKKKAGALSYSEDPNGMRSLLSTAFHQTSALTEQQTMPAGASPPSGTKSDPGTKSEDAMVHLCATFSADPSMLALGKLLSSLGGQIRKAVQDEEIRMRRTQRRGGPVPTPTIMSPLAGEVPQKSRDFLEFAGRALHECITQVEPFMSASHRALHECITQEKTIVLPWYLQVQSFVDSLVVAIAADASGSVIAEECPSSSGVPNVVHEIMEGGCLQPSNALRLYRDPLSQQNMASTTTAVRSLLLASSFFNSYIFTCMTAASTASAVAVYETPGQGGVEQQQQQQQQAIPLLRSEWFQEQQLRLKEAWSLKKEPPLQLPQHPTTVLDALGPALASQGSSHVGGEVIGSSNQAARDRKPDDKLMVQQLRRMISVCEPGLHSDSGALGIGGGPIAQGSNSLPAASAICTVHGTQWPCNMLYKSSNGLEGMSPGLCVMLTHIGMPSISQCRQALQSASQDPEWSALAQSPKRSPPGTAPGAPSLPSGSLQHNVPLHHDEVMSRETIIDAALLLLMHLPGGTPFEAAYVLASAVL